MKSLIAATLLLSLSSFSFTADATETHTYKVEQGSIKTVIAPISGLPKASCIFLDEEGNKIAGQNVTIVMTYDNTAIIEADLYYEQHLSVTKVVCLK